MAVDNTHPSVFAITMPASTVAYVNTTNRPMNVCLYGGTTTVISVMDGITGNFIQIGTAGPASFHLPAGGQFKVTYTVAPTAVGISHVNPSGL